MLFQILRNRVNAHVISRSISPHPRVILVPRGSRVGEEDWLLSIEQDIVEKIANANRENRTSSLQIHGVELQPGSSSDFLIFNTFSKMRKGFLHAMAHPALIDEGFVRILYPLESGINRLFLVSQVAFFEVGLAPYNEPTLTTCLENNGGDFFGSVVDYVREEFGEGMPIRIRPLKTHRLP